MLVSIRKSYPGQARKVMNAIWSLGQAMFTKCIVVVDEDCDVQDVAEVVLRVTNNIDPERDIQFTLGPVDSLDHASRLPNYGSKMGIDATRKWKAEGFERPWPAMIEMDRATKARVEGRFPRGARSKRRGLGYQFARLAEVDGHPRNRRAIRRGPRRHVAAQDTPNSACPRYILDLERVAEGSQRHPDPEWSQSARSGLDAVCRGLAPRSGCPL
jgi:hypothetical protein